MLGYTQPNNDVYIFFEDDEILRLKKEKISGTYFHFKDPTKTCPLEFTINDKIHDKVKTNGKRDDNGFLAWFSLEMRTIEYQQLLERKSLETHDGFRHICLKDASDPDILEHLADQMNYRQLKFWQSQQP